MNICRAAVVASARALRFGLAFAAATLAACAFTSSSPLAGYEELPRTPRYTVGLWDLGDGNCRGSIQNAEDRPYWVVDCRWKLGYGHCTHGLPLRDRGAGRYASTDGAIAFTILADGRLDESKDGTPEGRYEPAAGHLCGARRAGERPYGS